MPRTFFAICRVGDENIRRIPITAGVQIELEQMFDAQEKEFLNGRDEEIPFNGDWKPDANQLLVIKDADLAKTFNQTLVYGPSSRNHLDISNYKEAGIKGIFTRSGTTKDRILLQRFQTSQYLQREQSPITLVFSGNQFDKLSDQGFTLDNKLTAIIENNFLKFTNFRNLRTVLDIKDHYKQATDAEVEKFMRHVTLRVEDEAKFNDAMDERSRKLIQGITSAGILRKHSAKVIRNKAKSVGLQIDMQDGKLVLPSEKRRLKTILSFLEESVYRGVFSDDTFETNSKRLVQNDSASS